jgi:hypothetical protein
LKPDKIKTGKRYIYDAFQCRAESYQTSAVEPLLRQTKFTIHETLIRPVLLYGSETWVLTKREESQLLVFERKVFQTICGPKIENGVYRRNYKHDLDKEFDSPNADCATLVT